MRRLNDENFEHHHRIKWRAPALRPIRIGERCVQFRAKRLKFHRSLECLEVVTEIAQPLQSIIDIEKSRLPSHRIISDPSVTMESERRRICDVLRSIILLNDKTNRQPPPVETMRAMLEHLAARLGVVAQIVTGGGG